MGDLESRVHEMAASFVKFRSKEFLTTFLNDSGLSNYLYELSLDPKFNEKPLTKAEHLNHLIDDYGPVFGQLMGISYALGFADQMQGKTLTQLYVPSSLSDDNNSETKLILPGVSD